MKYAKTWPSDIPLTQEQSSHLESLTAILSPEQGLWVSGYLAGLASSHHHAEGAPQISVAAAAEGTESAELAILYASETGNARKLAELAGEIADEQGINKKIIDVADFKNRSLGKERFLLLITSTHGEGDPPEPAQSFSEFLFGRKAPKLGDTKFAVLGLGDSSYEHFCQTAVNFDEKFNSLGAVRIHPRAELDVDYETSASAWLRDVVTAFGQDIKPLQGKSGVNGQAVPMGMAAGQVMNGVASLQNVSVYNSQSPCEVEILDHILLNGQGSDKATYHIELSLEDSGLVYAPGDAIGVVASNSEDVVDEILAALKMDGAETVKTKTGETSLREGLLNDFELTISTPRFLQSYAAVSGAAELNKLVESSDRSEQLKYTARRQIVDIVSEYPVTGLGGQQLVDMLRGLTPRLYSLASSLAYAPDEAHLTVGLVKFDGYQKERTGVTSGLLERLNAEGDHARVYISPNKEFHLPENPDAPIIMVGAGTGIAPYRAFIQEREACEINAKSWLIFGDRHFRTDFLYQTEWQQFLKDEYLTRMDVAFSRDTDQKTYVQHRMRQHARDLYDWLEQGAHFYVCGDATTMAPDVHQALIDVVQEGGDKSLEDATEYVANLREEKRYRRDVY